MALKENRVEFGSRTDKKRSSNVDHDETLVRQKPQEAEHKDF